MKFSAPGFAGFWLLLSSVAAFGQTASSGWQPIRVPGAWETNGPPAAKNYDGLAWYRTWLKPHPQFFARHERNLYEESVQLVIRDLADAHEVFVNGRRIGGGGQFPPDFQGAKTGYHRHKVPVGTLRSNQWNEISIRVFNRSGPGGFLGEAPFIMNYFMECMLEGPWEFRLGDGYQPGGALTNKPVASAFENFVESSRVLSQATELVAGPKLPPAESAKMFDSADDLVVEQLLHEPEVAQPVHVSFDERGRLWVTQYRQYPYPAGLKMISRDKYYRAHYDKVPLPPPNHDRGRDIVSIHESSQGDGVFDRHKVFQDGLNLANSAVRGRGGVWVMQPPYLLFYPDKDFDDVPDGPPVVHLAGFGFEDTHSVANGLVWGPDGWLYGGHGSTSSSRVTRPGLDPTNAPGVFFEGCMVWRYHPEARAYEIFAEGGGNTFGLEFDAQGRLYSGHNGGDTRGWHFVQGGYYLMQGNDPGKFGPARNPYAFGQLSFMKTDTTVVRFSHFGAFVEGTAMPARYAGLLFALDPLHNVLIAAERTPLGSTFSTADRGPVATSRDTAFRPVYAANAPDGSLYVADFYEHYIAHGQHYQSQIDPTTGRIYRVRGKDAKLETAFNLAAKTTDQLIPLLSHSNKWHRHTAVRLLGERKDSSAVLKLKKFVAEDKGLGALNALWALGQIAGLDEQTALVGLKHPFAAVRLWTVRLLGDEYGVNRGLGIGEHTRPRVLVAAPSRQPSAADRTSKEGKARAAEPTARAPLAAPEAGAFPTALFNALVAQGKAEPDAEVRAQMAATARRLSTKQAMQLAAAVMGHDEDVRDVHIPLLCWWTLEAHIIANRGDVLALFDDRALWDAPVVFEHILPRLMRRFAVEEKRADLLVCARLFRAAPLPKHAAQLMKGFEEAFRGRPMSGLPEELVSAIAASGQAPLALRVRQGEAAAVTDALKLVQDAKAKLDDRLLYARVFGEAKNAAAVPALLATASAGASPAPLRKASLASLSAYDDESIGARVAELLPSLSGDTRTAAFALLASRPAWAQRLLSLVQSGKVRAADVPADVAERLRSSKEKSLAELATKLFPKQTPAEQAATQKRVAEIEVILNRGSANPYAGETIFTERCAGCHKLFFKGGNIGPDLTTYQRDNLGTMLTSIVNPNVEIREGYQYYVVETRDGRTLSGFFVDRDNQVTVLRGLEGENITLRSAEIADLQPMGRSLMPEGLLEGLDDQQLLDFFAFLRSSQPFTR